MKKIIAILIAALMVIPLGIVFSTAAETNIAKGASYTFTGKYTDANKTVLYPDKTGKELTDGVMGSTKDDCAYSKDLWVGLNWKGENTSCNSDKWTDTTVSINNIVVDLAAAKTSLTKFVLFACNYADGVGKPKSVEVSVSSDGTNYKSAGKAVEALAVKAEVADKPEYGIYSYTVTPSAAADARYIKFIITAGSAWSHVSEVQVFQGDSVTPPAKQVPAETYSLITTDTSKWTAGKCESGGKTETATIAKSGESIVIAGSTSLWPYAFYDIATADQHKVKTADFKLSYKFTVSGTGKANIVLFCEGAKCDDNKDYINDLTHVIVPDGQTGRDKTDDGKYVDDLNAGTYEGTIDLSKLNLANVTVKEAGYLTISSVKVFTVGGGIVTIEKLALESNATKPDTSNSTPSESTPSNSTSNPASSSSDKPKDVKTGDNGIAALVIFSVIALAGLSAVSIKKRR